MAKGIVIAGTHSSCGKTTVTLGVLAALIKKGLSVQSFKAGPDFIDPGLHRLITGKPSRNLDIWMCDRDYVKKSFDEHSSAAEISIIEGVMGMFDGECSTATLAALLDLPVLLVIDAYGMAESAGAIVNGFAEVALQNNTRLAGVIFSRVASERHYERLKGSVTDTPVFGYLPRDSVLAIPHRHLGLTVAEEDPLSPESIQRLADVSLNHIDIDAIARCGADIDRNQEIEHRIHEASPLRIAVAYDKAFCFYYEDNLDLLRENGAELAFFSPLSDPQLPDNIEAVYIGGGYPELCAKSLGNNTSMIESVRNWCFSGMPLYAECGGLMYLSRGVWDFEGRFFEMAGVFPFETKLENARPHLGYREIELKDNCILGDRGGVLRGHEFHYSVIHDRMKKKDAIRQVYSVKGHRDEMENEGYSFKNTLASYIHIHFGSNLRAAGSFTQFIREH